MNKFYTLILSVLTFSLGINAQITELFFSEYAEGSSNNKYLEIYNGTSSTVSLNNYAFPSVANDPTTPGQYEYWNTFPAGASIAPGDVYVIAHPSADPSILAHADHTHSYLSNGDDGYALVSGGTHNDADGDGNIDAGEMTGFTLLDHIGNWGGDPGTGWDVAGVPNATANHTLVRKSTVTGPNPCWDQTCGNSSAGTNASDSEWEVLPNDTWTYLGSHPHSISSNPTYNITLEVNTASIYNNGGSVGPNGMYAGGGFIGNAWGLQLTQSTTDTLIWSGVVTYDGTSGIHYTFLNSPAWDQDWGAKENLAGLPCGDPGAYNDRFLPTITSDTTIKHCFGSCETDGSCPAPPASFIDITFTLNVSSITMSGGSVDPTGMFLAGGGNFGNPGDNPMTDLGGGVWSITVTKPVGFTSDYTFTNGNSGWGAKENINGLSCAVPPYSDRNLAPVYSDTTIQHCFGTCDYDGSCASFYTPPNYTFQVDMSQSGYAATAVPHLRGSWNWGAATTDDMMTDADGDGIWQVTKQITGGAEYLFAIDTDGVGGWDVNESNDPTQSCTNGNPTYTNRVLTIATADTTLGVVCLGSCSPCQTNDCGATGTYTYGDNEDVSNAVGFTADPGDYITLDFSAGSTETGYDYWFINDAADGSGNTLATGDGSLVGVYTSTTGEISFYVDSDGSYSPGGNGLAGSVFVYSVSCSSPPSCPDPTGLAASNVTATGVDLSWTAGGTETAWNVDYGAPGFTPGTGTNITTNPYSLTGLSGNTAYDVYIQADCGSGDVSAWVGPVSISTPTPCPTDAICALYSSGDIDTDRGFTSASGSSTCPGSMDFVIPSGYVIDSVHTTYDMSAVGGGWMSEQRSMLYSPTLAVGEGALSNGSGGSTGTMSYDRTTTAFNGGSGTVTIELHAGRTYGGSGCGNTYNKVDNNTWNVTVYYGVAPACLAPSTLTATNVTSSSADLGWTANGTETAWNVQYGLAGFTPGTGTIVNVTTNPYSLTGLTSATSYDYWVQADCGTDSSSYVGPFTFATGTKFRS